MVAGLELIVNTIFNLLRPESAGFRVFYTLTDVGYRV